ncbi:MAG: hypothetical protein RI575_04465 [Balneolaceae bacterium]|nr:hypothetical protein [Balneolaceae bacterium]
MGLQAQDSRDLQYYVAPDQTGLNEFEAPFTTDIDFDGVNVRLGGSNTLQFQGISHENSITDMENRGYLPELENNFNLATSNLDFDVALDNGLRMHLRTYLSSQHHPEAWVKGGYLQIDRLDFIREGLAENLMDKIRVKVGHMELNYGDTHFRRTDNGSAIHNPFVGNYIMDSFTTEVAGELYYWNNGIMVMFGLSNGKLNQSVIKGDPQASPNVYFKAGYDNRSEDGLRFRLTGSFMTSGKTPSFYLYHGDRAGSRYYNVMDDGFTSGRWSPGYSVSRFAPTGPVAVNNANALMINPFVKIQGFEFFGVFETTSGKSVDETEDRSYTQIGVEALYRFGANENVYLGGRYNSVSGEMMGGTEISIDRINIGGGWFLTENVLTKVEYVSQSYSDFAAGSKYADGEFSGVVIEAVVSF